ncbi:hypothetical protein V501_04888 [Pseudogymnoascus sp. VKM F-4519 (FW-2642)]|nr:hypothetical protein V501_04888 [Pseudogymnoascus sp. VKM F-4519 (FW-2642)]
MRFVAHHHLAPAGRSRLEPCPSIAPLRSALGSSLTKAFWPARYGHPLVRTSTLELSISLSPPYHADIELPEPESIGNEDVVVRRSSGAALVAWLARPGFGQFTEGWAGLGLACFYDTTTTDDLPMMMLEEEIPVPS